DSRSCPDPAIILDQHTFSLFSLKSNRYDKICKLVILREDSHPGPHDHVVPNRNPSLTAEKRLRSDGRAVAEANADAFAANDASADYRRIPPHGAVAPENDT